MLQREPGVWMTELKKIFNPFTIKLKDFFRRIPVAIFCFLLCNLPHTSSYSDGAPDSQCFYMTPKHGFQQQVSPAPYEIVLDEFNIGPGERIVVKIISRSGFFKGFIIRAENAVVNDGQGRLFQK